MKITEVLRSEHEIILEVLAVLDAIRSSATRVGVGLDVRSAEEVLEFLHGFCDGRHHEKEEQLFFPALVAAGLPRDIGPLAVMSAEHDAGRMLIARMSEAVADARAAKPGAEARFGAAAAEYVGVMRAHIEKENQVLFPMGDGLLSEHQQASLTAESVRFEHCEPGAVPHAQFLNLARGLCERLGVERVALDPAMVHVCCGGAQCAPEPRDGAAASNVGRVREVK